MSCHFGTAVGSKWSEGLNLPTQQEELNTHTLIMFPTFLKKKPKHSPQARRSDHEPQLGISCRDPYHTELPPVLMTAIFAHQGKGKGSEQWHSRVPLWVCVTHHDFHSLCVYAPGYSIISSSCCFSPSCVSIRVHCRISICPHMAQRLLSSLLKFFPRTRGLQ